MTTPDRRRYFAERSLLIERGQWQPWADAAPVRAHARKLAAAGMSRRQVAAAAGRHESVISKLLYGTQERIGTEAAAAILRIPVPCGATARAGQQPATATMRRLRALAVNGWSPKLLAARLGMYPASVRRIRDGERGHVEAATARAVAALYDQLWDQAPPAAAKAERIAAAMTRGHAGRHGWAPPLAWDDDEIGDPDATPADGWERREGVRRWGVLAEDAAFLLAAGCEPRKVAERLGVDQGTLATVLARAAAKQEGASRAA